ncbi:hypothetical protein FHS01_001040 [Longimicrobium terrae]|uniref:Uncharacterized protein n=1 Tax=Longimicrobium terrae TaxID=1639882 RepID=A0A841GVG9_9BACT|nr:hypothetical protein [Longimicrobium terrae]MBB6069424.1 hypothetical protein [Longimicrobium terrae]
MRPAVSLPTTPGYVPVDQSAGRVHQARPLPATNRSVPTRAQRRQGARTPAPEPRAPHAAQTGRVLRAAWAASFGATLLISRPLWLTARDYPHVPVIPGLPQPPEPLAQLLFWAAVLALAASALATRGLSIRPDRPIAVVLAITALWAGLDQTRWQPYMLTYVIAGVGLLMAAQPAARPSWAMAPLQLAPVRESARSSRQPPPGMAGRTLHPTKSPAYLRHPRVPPRETLTRAAKRDRRRATRALRRSSLRTIYQAARA